jgi:hypothetical protein
MPKVIDSISANLSTLPRTHSQKVTPLEPCIRKTVGKARFEAGMLLKTKETSVIRAVNKCSF